MEFRWKTKYLLLTFVAALAVLQCAGAVEIGSAATEVVAAKDSSALSKSVADYVCDGIDDQKEINAALLAAGAGGTVELKEGTFHTTGDIVLPASRTLTGQGPGKTVLSMKGFSDIYYSRFDRSIRFDSHVHVANPNVSVKGFAITQYGWVYISSSNVKIEDVTVQDSHLAPQSGNYRVGTYGAFHVELMNQNLQNVEFIRCKAIRVGSDGFSIDNVNDPNNGVGHPQYSLTNSRLIDCQAISCGSGSYPDPDQGSRAGEIFACGFDLQEFVLLNGMTLQNCYAYDSWMDGFHWEARNADNVVVENCSSIYNGHRRQAKQGDGGRGFMGCRNAVFRNCYAENNAGNGFSIPQGWNTKFIDCTDNGSITGFCVNGLNNAVYSNHTFQNCISKNSKKYGFQIIGTTKCYIYDGYVENARGDGTYLSTQSGTTSSTYGVSAYGRNAPNIINTGGTGNTFKCQWLTQPITVNPTPTPTPTVTPTPTPTPTGSAAPYVSHTVPCRIEAENYDRGGEGIAYHDSTSGNTGRTYRTDDVDVEQLASETTPNVGYIDAGEWMQYTVNVQAAGTYDVAFRVASPYTGKTFKLQVDGNDACTVTVPNTGSFRTFTTVTKQVKLPAGSHVFRLYFTDGDVNINYMEFESVGTPTPTPKPDLVVTNIAWTPADPVTGAAVTLKATIKNQGTAATPADVIHSVLFTLDEGATGTGIWSDTHTSSIAPGEWITLTANGGSMGSTWTAVEGTHTISAHVDDVNRIAESDETNNIRAMKITVATWGDLNGDTVLNWDDVKLAADMVLGNTTPDLKADVNGNGTVDWGDVQLLVEEFVKRIRN